jgi:phosphatidylethanolamine/phosphatidyl-N-methylethanolamine N-methyltransferase
MESGMSTAKSRGALSVADVEHAFVERVYDNLAWVYDLAFGPVMQPGRKRAMAAMDLQPGTQILEVGVGTGLNLDLYPRNVQITGIDCSGRMLDRATERADRLGLSASLFQMDATQLRFPDDCFDVVYAPYLISVVPDPVSVLREMYRVCRPGGQMLVLNHFRSERRGLARVERFLSPYTVHIGFKADLDRDAVFAQAGLTAASVEMVNRPRIWSLVTFHKPA